jgi:F0F1-type ATP synthase membrane subunit b/b'
MIKLDTLITKEMKEAERRKGQVEQLKRDIVELELKQLRSLKAIMSEATEEDEKIYNEIEAEIQAKREEIRGLGNER